MRTKARRITIGAAVLLSGFMTLAALPSEAADVSDDVLEALIENDAKQVLKSLNNGKPEKRSIIQVKSSAMMIAALAQLKITGKDPMTDAKYATIRNNALKVAEAVKGKKFSDAVEPSKGLTPSVTPAAKVDTKPLQLHTLYGFDINELMAHYKKTDVGGLNVEADIKNFAKKGGATAPQSSHLAGRVIVTSELVDKMEPDGGFAGGKKTKAAWDDSNKKMREAAKELAELAKAAKLDPKKLQTAFGKLDGACVSCHDVFK